jgi:hypothetical protein
MVDQAFRFEWLAQKPDRSSLQNHPTDPFIRECGHKDDWRTVTLGDQSSLQLNSTQAGHLHICNKTARLIYMVRLKKLFGRRERDDVKSG